MLCYMTRKGSEVGKKRGDATSEREVWYSFNVVKHGKNQCHKPSHSLSLGVMMNIPLIGIGA